MMWKGGCFKPCVKGESCVDHQMRSLFIRASNYLERRYAEIERRIKSSEDVGDNGHGYDHMESLNWKEFERLYYESDLFKWHREDYLGDDGILDLEGMKRIWVESEERYEKWFIEVAKKRIFQDGSKNVKKTKQKKG
ncbi:hypothetical protein BGZ65_009549 [Modicella reniformis]|uniref:Uncharacterized protein n=1 Tax=Modicella reniformis TaxID=1440133 RepID=A0A9P6M833_9FUNG|nr:hypothetical protein BGZ65_009549 [Modicella reniformis]